MNTSAASQERTAGLLGIPGKLWWGILAVTLFMVGDGMEHAFLPKYMIQLGFTETQSSSVMTAYGLGVAVAALVSGVLAQAWGPRRTMLLGVVWWIVFDIALLTIGLASKNYPATMLLYGLRGCGYPLFAYAFVVWIARTASQKKLATAMGLFWFAYSLGLGFFGNYLPSFTIPAIGFQSTLWLELVFIIAAGIVASALLPKHSQYQAEDTALAQRLRETVAELSLVWREPRLGAAGIVRIINQIALYGFPVFLPIFVTTQQVGLTVSEWLQIWGTMFFANLVFNVLWGVIGDRIGWQRQVMWFGCVGTAITSLLLYYVPASGGGYWLTMLTGAAFGITMAAFVPMSAIFPSLIPDQKGVAMSVHNFAAGLANFIGPAIVTALVPLAGYPGVVWGFAVLYVVGAVLSLAFRMQHAPNTPVRQPDMARGGQG